MHNLSLTFTIFSNLCRTSSTLAEVPSSHGPSCLNSVDFLFIAALTACSFLLIVLVTAAKPAAAAAEIPIVASMEAPSLNPAPIVAAAVAHPAFTAGIIAAAAGAIIGPISGIA